MIVVWAVMTMNRRCCMDSDWSIGGREYDSECANHEVVANEIENDSDTITVTGYGCSIRTWRDALEVSHGKTHIPPSERVTKFYRGTHNLKRIVVLSSDGVVTLKAAEWCASQGIQIVVIDNMGRTLLTSGDADRNARLRRCQYQSADTGMDGYFARELVRRKALAQIETLRVIGELKFKRSFKRYRVGRVWDKPAWEILEIGLSELDHMRSIGTILMLEARLAAAYWDAFVGIPINWRPKDEKVVPPHWKSITGHLSTLSSANISRYAINPFHSALNYGYAVLKSQVLKSVQSVGLDPSCGFLHADKVGRDSLIYDLMEPHRPQVDQLMLDLFTSTTFAKGMFIPLESGECKLNPQFARTVVLNCIVQQSDIDLTVKWLVGKLNY